MSCHASKLRWGMLLATTPFIGSLLYAAWVSARSAPPPALETRIVSFKIVFDQRVSFPQTIRQSTINRLLGPGYELVSGSAPADVRADQRRATTSTGFDCRIEQHGGLLFIRAPQTCSTMDVAAKLGQLDRIKTVTIHMKDSE